MAVRIFQRKEKYYIEFTKFENGKRVSQTRRSLNTSDKTDAEAMFNHLKVLYESEFINPYVKDFRIKKALQISINSSKLINKVSTCKELVDEFLVAKAHLKTVDKYRTELDAFIRNTGFKYVSVENVTSRELQSYIWNPRIRVTESTRAYWYRTLNALFNFAVKDLEIIDRNPLQKVKRPKTKSASVDKMPTDDDLERIIKAYNDDLFVKRQQKNFREWQAMLWFVPLIRLYNATGCRREQPLDCKWKHIENDFSGIWVKGIKFEKQERVFYYIKEENAVLALKDLKRITKGRDDDYVFKNMKTNKPISGRHVYDMFRRYRNKADVNNSVNIHGIRHKSVTDDLNNGVESVLVSQQHKHFSVGFTVKNYAHLTNDSLKEGYKRAYKKKGKE